VDSKIKLRVQGLTGNQQQTNTYVLVLAEENSPNRIPVVVGLAEAQSIAIAMEGIIPPRPLTHDLFYSFIKTFDIHLVEIFIYKFEDGVFFSELVFEKDGRLIRIDSRTSDAIAIAIRARCSIYAHPDVVCNCSIDIDKITASGDDNDSNDVDDNGEDNYEVYGLEPEGIKDGEVLEKWLATLDPEDLQQRFTDAVSNENYEYAKMYKDELHRREIEEEGEKND
jgi:bifunctional DNase/RNase